MTFTVQEKNRRFEAIQKLIQASDLKALFLVGEMTVGHDFYGDFRYVTNNRIFFQRQIALVFPGSEPVMVAYSEFSRHAAAERSFVSDVRTSGKYASPQGMKPPDPMLLTAIDLLRERGVVRGRLGISLEILPASWYDCLKKEMPEVELVDVHAGIVEVRFDRSREEAEVMSKGAALADEGFEAALKVIRPGVSEYEIVAEIEYASRKGGSEEHFTLIGSGKFVPGRIHGLPLPCPPSSRRLEQGDSVILEITPRLGGYWTQLVRIVNIGPPDPVLEKMQTVARDAIEIGLEQFKPGKRVMDVVLAMKSHIESRGFVGRPPFGHICAIDLVEQRVDDKNERRFTPGFPAILHPMVYTPDGNNVIFWGQTYLATKEGYERLHRSGDKLLTV